MLHKEICVVHENIEDINGQLSLHNYIQRTIHKELVTLFMKITKNCGHKYDTGNSASCKISRLLILYKELFMKTWMTSR